MTGPTTGLSPKLSGRWRASQFRVRREPCARSRNGIRRFELTPETLPLVYEYMRDYLELGYEAIAAGVEADAKGGKSAHDVLARLGEVSQRVLVMTSDTDSLAPAYNRALERARNSRGHKFAGNHPGAHAGARRRVRAGGGVVRAPLVHSAASRAAAAAR